MLADESKHKVLYHLNYPSLTIIQGSTHYNSIVYDRLTDLDTYGQDQVEKLLAELESAEEALRKAKDCLKVAQVGDIRINTDHLENLKYEYRRLAKKLASVVDLPYLTSNGARIYV